MNPYPYKIETEPIMVLDEKRNIYLHWWRGYHEYSIYVAEAFYHDGDKLIFANIKYPDYTSSQVKAQYEYIRNNRIPRKETPITKNDPIMHRVKFPSREELLEGVNDYLGSDCWGLYIRNQQTLETIEILYDSKAGIEHSREIKNLKELEELTDKGELVLVMNRTIPNIYIDKSLTVIFVEKSLKISEQLG